MDLDQTTAQPEAEHQAATQEQKYVSLREQLAFYFSAFFRDMSYAIMGQANYFFTDVLGLNPGQLGTLLLSRELWNGINDPLMGVYFDRRAYTTEKARRFFKTTGLPIAIFIVLMFSPFRFSQNPVVNGWIAVGFILLCWFPFEAMHTLNGTAYMSYYNSITPNIQERSGIISRARMFSSMGSAAVGGGIPLLYGMFAPDNIQAKSRVFLFTAIAVGAGFVLYNFLMYSQVKERIVTPPQEQQSIMGILRGMLSNKLFLVLIISNTIGGIISQGNTGMYFWQYNIGSSSWQTWVGLAGFPSLLFAAWLMPKLCERFEKRNIVIACNASMILMRLLQLYLGTQSARLNMATANTGWGPKIFLAILMLATTLPDTVKGSIYWSMIADSVDYAEWKTAKRNDGTIYAMEGLMGKIIGSVGSVSTAVIIKLVRFVPNAPVQSAYTMRGLFVVPLVIEMISKAASSVPYFFYDMKRQRHAQIIEELKARKTAAEAVDAGA